MYCAEGSETNDVPCEMGSYCPDPSVQIMCPAGNYCKKGSTLPEPCPQNANCPAGSTANPLAPDSLSLFLQLSVDEATALATLDEVAVAVAVWLDAVDPDYEVTEEEITILCVCPVTCATNTGTSPTGKVCGMTGVSSAGDSGGATVTTLGLRQLQESTSEIQFLVAVDSDFERKEYEVFAPNTTAVNSLRVALLETSLPPAAVANPVVRVDVVQDTFSADLYGGTGYLAVNEEDFTQVLITLMVAVPVAMVVVGLAVYQNGKKAKPVKLPSLIVSILFAFYDFFSDVWFAVTPVEPEFESFTIAGAVVIVISTAVGLAIVLYVLVEHPLRELGPVDVLTASIAATNLELLALMPWVKTSAGGMPSASSEKYPTITVLVEDLPQLFIQGTYLIVSGDTANYVVLVSVAISGASLLLRFARGAMTFMRVQGASIVPGESPMTDWTADEVKDWFLANRVDSLSKDQVDALVGVLDGKGILALVQAVHDAHDKMASNEESDDEGEGVLTTLRKELIGG